MIGEQGAIILTAISNSNATYSLAMYSSFGIYVQNGSPEIQTNGGTIVVPTSGYERSWTGDMSGILHVTCDANAYVIIDAVLK